MNFFIMDNGTLINLSAVSSVSKFSGNDYIMKMINGNTYRISDKEYNKLMFLVQKDLTK